MKHISFHLALDNYCLPLKGGVPAKGTGIPTNHPWLVCQATAKQGRRALLTWAGWWSSQRHHTTARLPRADQSKHPRRCILCGADICQMTRIVVTNLTPSAGPAVPQPLANSNAPSLPFLSHHEAHIVVVLRWMTHLTPKAQCLRHLWDKWSQLNCIWLHEGKLCFYHDDGDG